MTALYSLYDALVSINVPGDKARAVVDAMEMDMAAVLATKSDLALLKSDLALVRQELGGEIALLRQELGGEIALLRQDLTSSKEETKSNFALLWKALESSRADTKSDIMRLQEQMNTQFKLQSSSLTVRLGSMLAGAIAILYALQRLGH